MSLPTPVLPAEPTLFPLTDLAITRLQGGAAPVPETGQRCPSCRSLMNPDSEECEVCARQPAEVPSTWVLLRLWRFARPYRWQLLAGFLLTLASTAATLVPPYLTIPLMDRVLIPFQNGQDIDTGLVMALLAGLLGSALLAWAPALAGSEQKLRAVTEGLMLGGVIAVLFSLAVFYLQNELVLSGA